MMMTMMMVFKGRCDDILNLISTFEHYRYRKKDGSQGVVNQH